jgi:hypothetical protein
MLTPRIIADMRPGDEFGDPDHPGLRVRRTNAARVFFYRYRASDAALREIKLGEFGPMTLAEARKALGRLKVERERGVDPQLQKQQVRTEARRKREAEKLASYTVENLVEDFIEEKLSKQKRGGEGARLLRRDLLPKLGDRAAAGLTRRELQDEVIRPMLKRAPRGGTYAYLPDRYSYQPTGTLKLGIISSYQELQNVVADGKNQRVEECLNKFVVKLETEAVNRKRHEEHLERQHRIWEEQERRRREREERKRNEIERLKTLEGEARDWKRAEDIRAYVAAAQAKAIAT